MKPMGYVAVIVLSFLLKRAGWFTESDRKALSKIMINITLPCAIVQAFSGMTVGAEMFIVAGIGFVFALLPVVLMYLTTNGVEKSLRAYRMINIGGYNIGCFSVPLLSAFFGSTGVAYACLFDIGNAIVMTGGVYAVTSTLLKTGGDKREGPGEILMKFLRSAPFDTYLALLALGIAGVELPQALFTLTQPAGQANGFLAMFIIGLMFEPSGSPQQFREAARELSIRYALAIVFALSIYFFTPFDLMVRRLLAIVCFAPLSSLAPVYTDQCHSDVALAGFTNSVSIAISLVCMLGLSMAFVA